MLPTNEFPNDSFKLVEVLLAQKPKAPEFGPFSSLSPSRWHDKHTYLSSLGMLGTIQLNFFADHIIYNNVTYAPA